MNFWWTNSLEFTAVRPTNRRNRFYFLPGCYVWLVLENGLIDPFNPMEKCRNWDGPHSLCISTAMFQEQIECTAFEMKLIHWWWFVSQCEVSWGKKLSVCASEWILLFFFENVWFICSIYARKLSPHENLKKNQPKSTPNNQGLRKRRHSTTFICD